MAQSLSDLEPLLASMNDVKPPGASKKAINGITQLSLNNLQAEQHIIQCMYRALKKAPATHKLGVLYVIDSVIRLWIDGAKKAGQDLHLEGRGEPGTYPAAVKRITELMPALMDDTIKGLPSDQHSKLVNLVAIWQRANTFPPALLEDFKRKLAQPQAVAQVNGTSQTQVNGKAAGGEKFTALVPTRPTMTPVGYPPQRLYEQGLISRIGEPARPQNTGAPLAATQTFPQQTPQQPVQAQAPPAPTQDVNSILAALANAAPPKPTPQPAAQPTAPPPSMPGQLPPHLAAMLGNQNAFPQNQALPPQLAAAFGAPAPQAPQAPPPFNPAGFQLPPGFPGFPPQPPPSIPPQFAQAPPPQPAPQQQADLLAPLRSMLPQNIINDQAKLVQALNLLQDLQKAGLPMEQWGPIVQAFSEQHADQGSAQAQYGGQDGYGRGRGRSRSPDRGHRGGAGGRGSPVYGSYQGPQQDEQRNGRGGRKQDRYRQRSPMRNSPMPNFGAQGSLQPKFIAYDNSLPPDHIRVLSRTLFIGGANGTQEQIHDLFGRFGVVASCITNRDKRHAFVKMTTREHTLNAKAGVEALQASQDRDTMAIARQTKWGVGFGPRECFDYGKGESVVPLNRLTEADVKWMLNAEHGGTGGIPLAAGMVVEEPDIEIGAGVSSKAMSRRVVPNDGHPPHQQNQNHGHEHGGHRGGNKHGGKGGKKDRKWHHHNRDDVGGGYNPAPPPGGFPLVKPEPVAVATPPAVPGFGFSLPGR